MDFSAITYSVFLPLLNTFHEWFKSFGLQSFGWSIVGLTAVVKLLLTPLTFKQIKSTKQMQVVQPKMKALQDQYKKKEEKVSNDPEKLKEVKMEFQQEMFQFYKKNNVNPLGGCLPLLVQMPILIGLFWTFSGAPFKEKPIMVDVKVVTSSQAHKKQIKPATKGEIYVDKEGRRARIGANTKGVTLIEGESFILETVKLTGDANPDPAKIQWKLFGNSDQDKIELQDLHNGKAKVIALSEGSQKVQALVPRSVKGDHFFFIDDLGKTGIFSPAGLNYDVLILVLLFGLSIWASSALNAPKQVKLKPGEVEDAQQAMQRSMQTMMPIMMTGMFFFIPIPTGALLYMVVSSVVQTGQTYFAMERYKSRFN